MRENHIFLKQIVAAVQQELPSFNDEMLLELRQGMIANIPNEIEDILKYLILEPFPHIKYKGYERVGPAELANYIAKGKWYNVDVSDSNMSLVRYNFAIEEHGMDVDCPLYVFVPYLFEQEFTIRGTAYYPIFGIMDKAILRIKNSKEKNSSKMYIGLEVPFILHRILFFFNDKCKKVFYDTQGLGFEATVIKTKAHHKVRSKEYPPVILYILAKYGYEMGLRFLGFEPSELQYVTEVDEDTTYHYFPISEKMYFKVHGDFLKDVTKKRILAALMVMFEFSSTTPTAEELADPSGQYFKFLLGRWVQKPDASPLQMINQAMEHLITIDRTVDYRAKNNLAADGIMVNDFYELCRHLFFKIDEMLIHKNNDLFHKKISITPQILYAFIKVLSAALFHKTQSGELLKADTLNAIFRKVTRLPTKFSEKMSIYMSHADQSNDNWLLGIGGKKIRQEGLRDPLSKEDKGNSSPDGGLRNDLSILAHPSHLFIESLLNLPASNPCKGGTINPFFRGVTSSGLFFEPPEYEQYKDIFVVDTNQENPEAYLLDPDDPWLALTEAEIHELEGDEGDEEEDVWEET